MTLPVAVALFLLVLPILVNWWSDPDHLSLEKYILIILVCWSMGLGLLAYTAF